MNTVRTGQLGCVPGWPRKVHSVKGLKGATYGASLVLAAALVAVVFVRGISLKMKRVNDIEYLGTGFGLARISEYPDLETVSSDVPGGIREDIVVLCPPPQIQELFCISQLIQLGGTEGTVDPASDGNARSQQCRGIPADHAGEVKVVWKRRIPKLGIDTRFHPFGLGVAAVLPRWSERKGKVPSSGDWLKKRLNPFREDESAFTNNQSAFYQVGLATGYTPQGTRKYRDCDCSERRDRLVIFSKDL